MFSFLRPLLMLIWQSVQARAAGGGFMPNTGPIPEILFALTILYVSWVTGEAAWMITVIGYAGWAVWPFAWMETGHGTAYTMGAHPEEAQGERKQTLSYVIDPLCKLFKQPLGETFYCWTFMGLKGFLIHLPLGWQYALAAAVLWPLAYYIGRRIWLPNPKLQKKLDGHTLAELLSGFFSGVLCSIAYALGT